MKYSVMSAHTNISSVSHCCNPPRTDVCEYSPQIRSPDRSTLNKFWSLGVSLSSTKCFSDCPFWPQLQLLSLHLSIWFSPPMNLELVSGFQFDRGFWDSEERFYLLIGLRFAEQIFMQLKSIATHISKLLKLINSENTNWAIMTSFLLTCARQMCWKDPAIQTLRQSTFKTTYDDDVMALNTNKAFSNVRNLTKCS